MREVKFRAWDAMTQIMVYNVQDIYDSFNPDSENLDDDKWNDTGFIVFSSFGDLLEAPIPVMQYTGLKDKNGKEIYEGDILKSHAPGDNSIAEVQYIDNGFWCDINNNHFMKIEPYREVIGNIHENGDLLE